LLTLGDLRQFLEAVLAAVCDRLQAAHAFIATLGPQGLEMFVTIGGENPQESEDLSENLLEIVVQNGQGDQLFAWGGYWLVPLFSDEENSKILLGLLGISRQSDQAWMLNKRMRWRS